MCFVTLKWTVTESQNFRSTDERLWKLALGLGALRNVTFLSLATVECVQLSHLTCISIDKIMMLSLQIWLKTSSNSIQIQSAQIRRHWIEKTAHTHTHARTRKKRNKMFIHRLSIDVECMRQERTEFFGGNDHLRIQRKTIVPDILFLSSSPSLPLLPSSLVGQCASRASVYLFSSVIWLNFWFSIIPLICFVFVFTSDAIAST